MIALDEAENKTRLGANTIPSVSLVTARLMTQLSHMPLYRYPGGIRANFLSVSCMSIVNGGVHARGQGTDSQEYMITPCRTSIFREAMRWGSEVYYSLRRALLEKGMLAGVGDEGGFAPVVSSNREPLELIVLAVGEAGYRSGKGIVIYMDPASNEFYRDGKYHLRIESIGSTSQETTDYYQAPVKNFSIALIEDGLAEDDRAGWKILHGALRKQMELASDDLLVINVKCIQRDIDENLASSALTRLSQIGPLSETLDAVQLCHDNNWGTFILHRSGKTADNFIADMTVVMCTGHLEIGALYRGECTEKYSQLIRIEDELGSSARFAGKPAFKWHYCANPPGLHVEVILEG